MAKSNFFGKKLLGQSTKNNFELEMLKLLKNHVKSLRGIFSFFLFYVLFWKFWPKSANKSIFAKKKITFGQFLVKIFKNKTLLKKREKKKK